MIYCCIFVKGRNCLSYTSTVVNDRPHCSICNCNSLFHEIKFILEYRMSSVIRYCCKKVGICHIWRSRCACLYKCGKILFELTCRCLSLLQNQLLVKFCSSLVPYYVCNLFL